MNVLILLPDVARIFSDLGAPPDWKDRAQVKAYFVKATPDVVDLAYDIAGKPSFAALDHTELLALSQAELESAVSAALPPEKIGDGTYLKWLIANLPTILAWIQTIIAVVPKAA